MPRMSSRPIWEPIDLAELTTMASRGPWRERACRAFGSAAVAFVSERALSLS